uniref:Peptidase M12B domain-containing protein n=1 Tax=Romanomermis culicivorax TaxID=13658 RepID=A0A915KJA4_ROMCU
MSSDNTPDWSLAEAARVLDIIVMNLRLDLVKAFKMQGWKVLFYGPDENLCSIPETSGRSCVPSNATGITVGNLIIVPYIKYTCRSNGFMTYSTLVHELGHALNAAFNQTDPNLQLMIQLTKFLCLDLSWGRCIDHFEIDRALYQNRL